MSLSPVIMHRGTPESWHIMPLILKRVMQFTGEHTDAATDPLPMILSTSFGGADPRSLIVGILDDEKQLPDALVGHVVCGTETYLGRTVCMVYQFEKDNADGDWVTLNNSLQAMIDSWCHSLGLDEIMVMAESKSRARLFSRFGYQSGPVLMRRKFNG